ncbi:MAG: hypothetical protein HY279_12215 [Nitrospinae bacterium]|nr:hypothetical protein [Nitrospinota bacterium]
MKQKSTPFAKITRPNITQVYPRRRLFRLLDRKRKRHVVWICGPPGSGKTTLISSYLNACKLTSLWYRVDEGDADAATFFYYMGQAVMKASPHKRAPMPLLKDELRLTFEEMNGIVRLRGAKERRKGAIRDLYNKTDGWAAGLTLMLESEKTEEFEMGFLSKSSPYAVFDYFAGEILGKTDKETRGFLLKTALLPSMTPDMAERLTGIKQAGRIISDLIHRNYFVTKHIHREPVYHYHQLFREFLLARARDFFKPTHLLKIKRTAASILIDANQYEDAFRLLREVCDWDGAARLILKHAPLLMAQGRGVTLKEWLDTLPEKIIANNPYLIYWSGVCQLPFNPADSLTCFEKALQLFRKHNDSAGIFMAWASAAEAIFYILGDFKILDKWIALLEDIMLKFPAFPSVEIGARVSYGMAACLLFRQPYHPDFDRWIGQSLLLSEKIQNLNLKILTLFTLSTHSLWTGDFAKAEAAIKSLQELVKNRKGFPAEIILSKVIEAFYTWLTVSNELCLKSVSEGLKISESSGIHIWDHHLLIFGAAAAISSGDIPGSDDFLKKMTSAIQMNRHLDTSFHHNTMAWSALLKGDKPLALFHQEKGLDEAVESGSPLPEAINSFGMSQILHDTGKHKKAGYYLDRAYKIGRRVKSRAIEYMCLLSKAQFDFDSGKDTSAFKFMRKAMALGREKGYLNSYYWRPDVMARLCMKALEAGIEKKYVQELIHRRNLNPPIPPFEKGGVGEIWIEDWPYQVKIFTLGQFKIIKDEKSVRFGRKVQKRPLQMLKALIALGGHDVKEEQLSDMLWHDAEGDMAHESFKITIRRLRQLVGIKDAIQLHEGLVTLDQRYCWVDTWAFEHIYRKINSILKDTEDRSESRGMSKRETMNRIIRLSEKAISFYKGHFLPADEQESWAISLREDLRSKFLRLIIKVGKYYEDDGEWERAIEYFHRGLEIDKLAEEFYQHLMTCYHRLGQGAEAIAAYNRCRSILSNILGINPSFKTEEIYSNLLRK